MTRCLNSPTTSYDFETGEPDMANTIRTVDFRHLLGTPVLQLEFAPLLNRIISPPLRPVNRQIIRAEERTVLSRLVSIMIALDLQFVLERNEDGQLVYRLEPPVEVFVTYDGKRTADMPPPRFATRQLVASEMEQAHERRRHPSTQVASKEKASQSAIPTTEMEEEPEDSVRDLDADDSGTKPSTTRIQMQNFNWDISARQTKRAKIDPADKPPTDFFGRPLPVKPKDLEAVISTPEVVRRYRVSYKYNEGSSAAVRKPVKMAALLL